MPVLTLHDYISLTKHLPQPSPAQMKNFADYVSEAHSWYKHLPLLPPGKTFIFYVDPFAGMQHSISPDGTRKISKRTETGFHYSWIRTDEYRARFGHLAYSQAESTQVYVSSPDGMLVPSDCAPEVWCYQLKASCSIPSIICEEGSCLVSGIVHTDAANHRLWWFRGYTEGIGYPEITEECRATLPIREIVDRCRLLHRRPELEVRLGHGDIRVIDDYRLVFVDYPLHLLLVEERIRQKNEMVKSMTAVADMIYSNAT